MSEPHKIVENFDLARAYQLQQGEIERLKIERENTCMLCNMLEREVCAEQKVHLRAEIERLTTELRLVRKAARDFLARIEANPERTLLKAAIFE